MYENLIVAAREASTRAHAPFSHFHVGAALLSQDGHIFTGGNVECSSYGGTICAERSALVSAIAAGQKRFTALAVYTDTETPTTPCGICRQLLMDFSPTMTVICVSRAKEPLVIRLDTLLPHAFSAAQLEKP